ncbi:hypothetical protein LOTGIDRAFT_159568 [Lottia gigantea]|uniref:MORN repeat-containing protein 4 n=1 Tax=Lottia gigantea TaxID=225164 RepID=V4C5F2_LOTGI|nr:hypothetical protein LOTGIDRAFT_159568 [Lottia gigantea]ESO96824.1 hypothetical protein LOTGIDRAFT_159568 [Lottia gigantea]
MIDKSIIMSTGVYNYPDGSIYTGEWNPQNKRHGYGHMKFTDGSQYWGNFENGLCSGCGIMKFKDGSSYAGELKAGKFDGFGIFTRCDNMKFEGEFKEGKIWGLGLVSFSNNTHGLPRNEGYFEENKIIRREKCSGIIEKSRMAASKARSIAG